MNHAKDIALTQPDTTTLKLAPVPIPFLQVWSETQKSLKILTLVGDLENIS